MGAFGVDLFFVISGFIVCKAAAKATSAANFLRNRFIRVAPLYYVVSTPCLVGAIFAGKFALSSLATSLLFWPIWGTEPTFPLLTVGWSLCFEALFYTGLSVAVQFGKRGAYALVLAYTCALALNVAGAGGVFRFIGNPLLLEFLFGVVIALTSGRRWPPIAGAGAILGAIYLLGFRAAHGFGPTYDGLRSFLTEVAFLRVAVIGPAAFLMVWGALQLEPWCKGVLVRALGHLGDASYSIYLTHPLVIVAVEVFMWRSRSAALMVMPFLEYLLAIAAGLLAYEFLEKPLLAVVRRVVIETPRQASSIVPG